MKKGDDPSDPSDRYNPDNRVIRPRDAATLVILDRSGTEPKVLMGKRRADLAFMAGKYVFPGGRVDPADKSVDCADALRASEASKLLIAMRGTPSPARAPAPARASASNTSVEA